MSLPIPLPDDPPAAPPEPAWRGFARAPLVPVALAASVGLLADRYIGVPLGAGLTAAVVALVGSFFTRKATPRTALGWLLVCTAALAAAHHHTHRDSVRSDDIGRFAKEAPVAVRVRGVLADEPDRWRPTRYDPLLTVQREARSAGVLDVTALDGVEGWRPASGKVRLAVEGRLDDLHCGDMVEVTGRLSRPDGPHNPGERDYQALLRDRQITAELRVKRSADPVVRLEEGWRASLFGWLAMFKGWGARALQRSLPDESGLATALLLGDSTALDREEWDVYVRTGVIHVLAISGQHLVVLSWFAWFVLRLCGVRSRHAAWAVAVFLIAYTLMTGARPSAIRATVMVCAVCGGIILRRPVLPANAFALAWLIVVGWNPTDPFTIGCQLSFLSVFVLIWGVTPWLAPGELTAVEQLLAETRGLTEKILRAVLRAVWQVFVVSAIITLVNAPLVLAWQNIASPIAIVLGPPLILLTAIALVAGFLLLLAAPFGTIVAWPLARVTEWSLSACEWLVHLGDRVPFGHLYAPAPPVWWLVGFYLLVAGGVLLDGPRAKKCVYALAVWTVFGLLPGLQPRTSDEARVTFLAVGHGGCVVHPATFDNRPTRGNKMNDEREKWPVVDQIFGAPQWASEDPVVRSICGDLLKADPYEVGPWEALADRLRAMGEERRPGVLDWQCESDVRDWLRVRPLVDLDLEPRVRRRREDLWGANDARDQLQSMFGGSVSKVLMLSRLIRMRERALRPDERALDQAILLNIMGLIRRGWATEEQMLDYETERATALFSEDPMAGAGDAPDGRGPGMYTMILSRRM